jgi:protein gp37
MSKRVGEDIWGRDKPRKYIKSVESLLRKLNAKAGESGKRHLVFVNSMSDFFESDNGQPIIDHNGARLYRTADGVTTEILKTNGERRKTLTLSDLRSRAFQLFDECNNLTFLLLTKRPENIRLTWQYRVSDYGQDSDPAVQELLKDADRTKALNYRPNVWIGTTCENQEWADKRLPELKKCREFTPVLFISAEPLLGPLELCYPESLYPNGPQYCCGGFDCGCMGRPCDPPFHLNHNFGGCDWVIGGCESGNGRRPSDRAWFESLASQCRESGVPYFHKQMEVGGKVTADISQFPEWLRIQEFPQ